MSETSWVVGYHAVLAALEGGRRPEVLWLQDGRHDRRSHALAERARSLGVPIRSVPRPRLDEVAGGVPHNGCAARCGPVALVTLDEVMSEATRSRGLVLLDDVTDPHNLGAVLRTCAAFAVGAVIIAGPSAPPLGGAVAKAAGGLLGRVPLVRVNVAADALARLREEGWWAIGASAAGTPLDRIRRLEPWVLCLGSEARGLRAKTRSQIDLEVAIPMAPSVESLNLSVAAGILIHEMTRTSERSAE